MINSVQTIVLVAKFPRVGSGWHLGDLWVAVGVNEGFIGSSWRSSGVSLEGPEGCWRGGRRSPVGGQGVIGDTLGSGFRGVPRPPDSPHRPRPLL